MLQRSVAWKIKTQGVFDVYTEYLSVRGHYSQLSVALFTASRSYLKALRCLAKGSKKDDVSSFLKIMVRLWGGDQVSKINPT